MKKLLFLFVFAFSTFTFAQERFDKIEAYLSLLEKNNKFMGSLTIQEEDKIVFSKSYGFLNAENKVKATNETKYKIGSITKTFTAVMIMQLIEENKLRLDTKLSKFYPKIPNAEKISIAHLLHHRTGIVDYINGDTITQQNLYRYHTKEEMINKITAYKPLFEPGTKYEYSNSNYNLLGYIVENVTKKSYSENLEKRICQKAGLTNTYLSYEKINSKNNEGISHIFDGTSWYIIPEWENSIAFSAGAILSNSSDLTKFMHALFEYKLIKKQSLIEMKNLIDGYGKGLVQMPFGDRQFFGHTGGIENFRSVVGYNPDEKMGISLIVNGDNYERNDIMIGVLSIYYKMPFPLPTFEKIKIADIENYIGTYASKEIPLKIVIFEKDGELLAQATGQSSFPLTFKGDKTFVFSAGGIEIQFENKNFILKQGGMKFNFTKE